MQAKNIYRFFSGLVVITFLISTNLVAHASHPASSSVATANPVRLAWFYKPPADGNLQLIASNFSTYIMTKGNESARDQLLFLGAPRPVWEYLRFEAIMDPGSCSAMPWKNQVAYLAGDFCTISSQHPDWFLLTTGGSRITHMTGSTKFILMDPGNAGWRAFFLERVSQILAADPVWDGVFLDNVEATNAFHINAGEILAAYPDNASFQAAVQGFLQYLRVNYFQPHNKQLLANLISRTDDSQFTSYLTYLDGVMHEGWAIDDPNRWRSASTWEKHMALAEQTQALGKSIILVSHGAQTDLELQKFAYASYLLIMNEKASFRYGMDTAYNQAWLFDTYKIDLGSPLGRRYQRGTAWKRDFSNGFVSVDPNSHAVVIQLTSASPTATSIPSTATPAANTFRDVPVNYWAFPWIESLFSAGVTSGCGPANFCPEGLVTRDQMAVFVERSLHGRGYIPLPATGGVFTDVSAAYWSASWIEEFVKDRITIGCGGGNYCPGAVATRAQMAVFLLRAKYGSDYTPPLSSGLIFADVSSDYWAAAWIEKLSADGITTGCGTGNYCPDNPLTRAQMAVFLVKMFNLK